MTAFVKSKCSTRAAARVLTPITSVGASTTWAARDLRFRRLSTWTTSRNGCTANCNNLVTHRLQQSQQISDYAKQVHQHKSQMDQLNLQIQQFANRGRDLASLPGNVFGENQQFETMGQASQSTTGALAATQAGNQINMLVGQEMMKLSAQTAAINQAVLEERARQLAGKRLTCRNIENAYGSDESFQKSSQLVAKPVGEWS
ncbi:hypothetical protein AB7M18_000962 [Pseudomonas viridiflava]